MREVSGTTWTFQMIILFILIFACFLTLVLSYSKAYKVKNEFLTIVEKYEIVSEDSMKIFNSFLNENSYKTRGKCPDESWMGSLSLDSYEVEEANENQSYYYCYKKNGESPRIYYDVMVFYNFNLPVLGEIGIFKIEGRTKILQGAD